MALEIEQVKVGYIVRIDIHLKKTITAEYEYFSGEVPLQRN
jgi:hypothetical protein